jgi:hypothetical protein
MSPQFRKAQVGKLTHSTSIQASTTILKISRKKKETTTRSLKINTNFTLQAQIDSSVA